MVLLHLLLLSNRSYPDWIKEPSCGRRNLRRNLSCQLHLPDLLKFYLARVRAQDGGRLSEWAYSDSLQPYKDSKETFSVEDLNWVR